MRVLVGPGSTTVDMEGGVEVEVVSMGGDEDEEV